MLLSIAYFCFSPMFKSVTTFSDLFKTVLICSKKTCVIVKNNP
ncbi:hypothetical protein SAMN05216462_0285 [Xylanibacter ruminicola]|uniref:Uncharacterized protein n=1 Tax=Xylanibacter ruminicola TaxID=839 RepID=A0A1H3XQD9_XYLRU|nr:hypothetical protein SAMN05216462_0285 [Xylanibacter ruminicola]